LAEKSGAPLVETHAGFPLGSLGTSSAPACFIEGNTKEETMSLELFSHSPTNFSSSKGLRDPYQSDCVVNRGALLHLFFEDQVRDAEDGQTSIVPVGRQWNTWSAETLLEASESTAQIVLN
jgi:hypothetical protein